METTLTVIGGGSVNWMPTLMRDLYLSTVLDGGEIRLVDPVRERTEAVAAMLQRFNRQRDKHFDVKIIENRREALDGANAVLATFSPGGIDGLHLDLEMPVKYGIIQPVSGTVGPSGISNSLRTVAEAYDLIEDMEAMCPGAWMLSETNPMTAVTWAMNKAARTVKVVGLCHEFHKFGHIASDVLDFAPPTDMPLYDMLYTWLKEQGVEYTVAGINHFIWVTEAKHYDMDLLPKIRQFAAAHPQYTPKEKGRVIFENYGDKTSAHYALFPWDNQWEAKLEACRQWGYLSVGGDRHLIEFLPALCNAHNGFGKQYGVNKTTGDHRKHLMADRLDYIRRIAAEEEHVDWSRSAEEFMFVLEGIVSNQPAPCIVNVPNEGQIENLPRGAIVETFATVDASGVHPKPSGPLPEVIAAWARIHLQSIERTVEAGLQGSRQLLIEALSLDPLAQQMDFRDIPAMADDIIETTRTWLPRFH